MAFIDISVTIGDSIPVWDGDVRPSLTEERSNHARGTIQTTTLKMNVHTGTHIDAPRHFYQEGKTAPNINLELLNGECQVIEVPNAVQLITKEDLSAAGYRKGVKRLLIKSVNSKLWREKGNQFDKAYSALTPSASEFLINQGVFLVGIDYLSIAPFSNVWDVHQQLLSKEVVILEGLDLSEVSSGRFELICLPLKLDSKDGLPVRAVLKV